MKSGGAAYGVIWLALGVLAFSSSRRVRSRERTLLGNGDGLRPAGASPVKVRSQKANTGLSRTYPNERKRHYVFPGSAQEVHRHCGTAWISNGPRSRHPM